MKPEVGFWTIALMTALVLAACDDDDDDFDVDAAQGLDAAAEADAAAMADAEPAEDAEPAADAAPAITEVDCDTATVDTEVSMEDIAFVESEESVPEGGVVRWTNEEDPDTGPDHTVTSGSPDLPDAEQGVLFDSGNLAPGDSYCLQFDDAGTIEYFCEIHPSQMRDATITVEAS